MPDYECLNEDCGKIFFLDSDIPIATCPDCGWESTPNILEVDALRARCEKAETENSRLCPIGDRPVIDSLLAQAKIRDEHIEELRARVETLEKALKKIVADDHAEDYAVSRRMADTARAALDAAK